MFQGYQPYNNRQPQNYPGGRQSYPNGQQNHPNGQQNHSNGQQNHPNGSYNNYPGSDRNRPGMQGNYDRDNGNGSQIPFQNNPKLSSIDPTKLKIIMEIKEQSKNKSMEELLPQIMKINQELNRRNMNFSKSETNLLMEALEESLSPAEKQKFNMLKGFLQ